MKKILPVIIVIAVIAVIVILGLTQKPSTETEAPPEATSSEGEVQDATINEEIEGIDTGDVEGELKGIDDELKNL